MAMSMGSFASRVVATVVVATDGTGDFTDIQSAIDALPAGGGVVYIKEGDYVLTDDLDVNIANVSLVGAGHSTVISTVTAGITLLSVTHNYFTVENICFDTSGANAAHCIFLDASHYSIIRACWFIGSAGTPGWHIYPEGCDYLKLLDCFFLNGTECFSQQGNACDHAIISGNFFNTPRGICVNLAFTSDGMLIANNTFRSGSDSMLYIRGYRVIITNNLIDTTVKHGIYLLGGYQNIIGNNVIRGCDSADAASYDGIFLYDTVDNIVSNNVVHVCDRYQINVSDAGCANNKIEGNSYDDTGCVGGINDAGTGTVIDHNQSV